MKNNILAGKCVVVAVTGGIAAYKSCEIVSSLKKDGAYVRVVMTENATKFVSPLTFETLSHNPVVSDTFRRPETWEVEHISLAKRADLVLIAPCTANVIGKLASGIADDFLTTMIMACRCPVVIAPAMNSAMYTNPIFVRNCETLAKIGYLFIDAEKGNLACGDEGVGRLPSPEKIVNYVRNKLTVKGDFSGKKVLITAGATSEPIDAVRYITNRSSGKMGWGLAKAASERGAFVTVVSGLAKVDFSIIPNTDVISVLTTEEMLQAVKNRYKDNDYIIMAAAPGDYRPLNSYNQKIKDETFSLTLTKNPDIAEFVGKNKDNRKLIIFCAETCDLKRYAKEKLIKKHADMVVANDIGLKGAGFDSDTNIVSIITSNGEEDIPLTDKNLLAHIILDRAIKL